MDRTVWNIGLFKDHVNLTTCLAPEHEPGARSTEKDFAETASSGWTSTAWAAPIL